MQLFAMPENIQEHFKPSTYIPFKTLLREKFKRFVPHHKDDKDYQQSSSRRSRMEKVFPEIGAAFIAGHVVGGTFGFMEGVIVTSNCSRLIRRTQIFNHALKRGKYASSSLGSMAMMYCTLGVLIQLFCSGKNDFWNCAAAGGTTGLLFRASAGMKKILSGGLFGLTFGSLHGLMSTYRH
ncbi:mitochondrial import inner membrane translocase subunit Tim23-like [Topomyia yanbarensis]|uniref:mitochondrial import inner membrane translocase subunit Tim23-like n=1 Tax=Topomyia yanbarensis TaxID=2498891 RepID=UPI00273B5B4D|nr:mitochondrial import inner membrane translocase subunit Tim23-like [Topomyia yanbarensis]